MARRYARGTRAWGECKRSGKRLLLKDMVNDGQIPRLLVAPDWFEPKHPQEYHIDVSDSSALYRPAPEDDGGQFNVIAPPPPPPPPPTTPVVEVGFPLVDVFWNILPNPFFGYQEDPAPPSYTKTGGPVILIPGGQNTTTTVVTTGTDFPVTPPTPINDDVILFIISCPDNLSPLPPAITANTSGVNTLSRSTNNANNNPFPNSQPMSLFWKRWNTGDPTTFNFRHGNASSRRMYADCYVFRNVTTKQPFDNFAWVIRTLGSAVDRTMLSPMPQVNNANSMIFEGWVFNETALVAASPIVYEKQISTLQGQVDAIIQDQASNRIGWRKLGCYPLATDTVANLFTWSGPGNFTSWPAGQKVGVTVSQADATMIDAQVVVDGSNGEHGIFQDITLTAGVTYCLAVNWICNNNNDQFFFGVRDTTTTWNGQMIQYKSAQSSARSFQTAGAGFSEVKHFIDPDNGNGVTTQSFGIYTATVTGVHRFGMMNVGGTIPGTGTLSFIGVSQRFRINQCCVSIGDAFPGFRYTNGTGVSVPSLTSNGYQNRSMKSMSFSGTFGGTRPATCFVFEIVGNQQTHAAIMEEPYGKVFGLAVDTNRRGAGNDFGTKIFAKQETAGGAVTGHAIGRIQFPNGHTASATGKYYFECTFGAKMGAIGNTEIGVYLGSIGVPVPGCDAQENGEPGNGAPFSSTCSMGYNANGSVRVNAGATAVSGFTTGDTIGVAVNYVAGTVEWFKNGVSQTVSTMTTEFREHPCQGGAYCGGGGGGLSIAITFKMRTSEFSFTKPSGFQDWDWLSQ